STTQVVSGGIMGAGLGRAGGKIHWRVVRGMAVAGILTPPAAGLMGALGHEGIAAFPSDTAGVVAVGVVASIIACTLFGLARRTDHVNAKNVSENMDTHIPRKTASRPVNRPPPPAPPPRWGPPRDHRQLPGLPSGLGHPQDRRRVSRGR